MTEKKRIDLSKNTQERPVDLVEAEQVVDVDHGKMVVSENIRLNFLRFVKMLKTHDLTDILEDGEEDGKTIVIPADLLADISNSEMVIEKRAATTNIYSGIFMYGLAVGVLVAILVAIGFNMFTITVAMRDLVIVGGVILAGLLLPFIIIATEPTINEIQEKHRDYLERVTSFLSKR